MRTSSWYVGQNTCQHSYITCSKSRFSYSHRLIRNPRFARLHARYPWSPLRSLFPVFFILGISQFDIIQEIVVGRPFAKLIRRAVFDHKTIQLVAVQMDGPFDDILAETMVDELILLFIHQPVLKSLQTLGSLQTQDIEQLVQVHSRSQAAIAAR